MSNSFGRNSNFRVIRLTTIFRGSFETICCKLAADRKSALRSSTFSQCCASCQQRISNLRCFHSELLVSPEVYWSTISPTLMERSRCCAGAQAKTCAGHKQTPSTHLPDTNPVKDSGRVRCRHLCQACCPLKDRPTAIWNLAQIQYHACINQYDSLLGEVNGWKSWEDTQGLHCKYPGELHTIPYNLL